MISMRLRRVSTLVVFDRQGPGFAPGNAGFNTLLLQGIPEPVGVISTVGQHPLRLGQIIEQGSCAGIIAYLTGGLSGRPFASARACNFVFMPPLVRPINRPSPPFLIAGLRPCDAPSNRLRQS